MKSHVLLLAISMPLASQVVGTWNLSSHPDLSSLIEQATAAMEPTQRSRAREALRKNNVAYQRIAITHASGYLTIQFDQFKPQRLRDDALAIPWTGEDGTRFLVSARMEGDRKSVV